MPRSAVPLSGILVRLAHDARGSALAMMAAMLIPLAAFSGSAIDMARLYTVKTRLQQACDAGVLAGRRFMTLSGSDQTLDANSTAEAQTFFNNNFRQGWFKTANQSFTPTLQNGQVHGQAQADVPMTIMRMFGQATRTITVNCQAQYDVADADIMFVLDETGSMACTSGQNLNNCNSYAVSNTAKTADARGNYPVTEQSGSTADTKSRIQNVREAIASFYTTLTSAKQDQNAHFRFGFVPYSATVNVSQLGMPRSYFTSSQWTYQSRQFKQDLLNGKSSTVTSTTTQANCVGYHDPYTPNASGTTNYPGSATTTNTAGYASNIYTFVSWKAGSGSSGTCTLTKQPVMAQFAYKPYTLDVSNFGSGQSVANPAMLNGFATSNMWNGCIEERDASTANHSPAWDVDVDDAPDDSQVAGVEVSKWRPMWGGVEFARSTYAEEDSTAYRTPLWRYGTVLGTGEWADELNEVPCPLPMKRLSTMSASDINTYLSASNGFTPYGVTYHDIGMMWGVRLLSPDGMFASDTAAWTGHVPPARYIIFLTDGLMETDNVAYAANGMEYYDHRLTSTGNASDTDAAHETRFSAACQAAKNKNITVFLIAYASSITSLSSQMQNCASPGQAYTATSADALNAAFAKIAAHVAQLRLSQ